MSEATMYRVTSLRRERLALGPFGRTMPRALWWSWGGGPVSYERDNPVPVHDVLEGNTQASDETLLSSGPLTLLLVDVILQSHSGHVYRGTSPTRKRTPLGPHRRPLPGVLGRS